MSQLSKDGEVLKLSLSGIRDREEFANQLEQVKRIPGRRFNPETKDWEFQATQENAQRLIDVTHPQLNAEVRDWLLPRSDRDRLTDVTTPLPADAALAAHPWRDLAFPFQRAAIDWLAQRPRSILGDDMGLGKTFESIGTVDEWEVREGRTAKMNLVICPNSITGNWQRELAEGPMTMDDDGNRTTFLEQKAWTPKWSIILDGSKPKRAKLMREWDAYTGRKWLIVNWEKLRLMPELAKYPWDTIVADEAHRAKNRKAKQTMALLKLKAHVQLALTGTPILNSPDELWPLLAWIRPEQYSRQVAGGGYWAFYHNYVDFYESQHGKVVTGVKNADALRFELADKMIRRRKTDIDWASYGLDGIPEKLPPKVMTVPMKPKQQKLYDEIENQLVVEIEQAPPEDQERFLAALERGDMKSLSLTIPNAATQVVRQRQVSTSPAILGAPDDSGKFDAAQEIISDNPGKPFVVFSWYKPSVELFASRLRRQKPSIEAFTITGDTPPEERQSLVERFQNGEFPVLCCTIAAGGTGLTMTRADTAIFLERDWTPGINKQAEDRLHRHGQKSPVSIVILESAGTIDQSRIAVRNRLKEKITKAVIGD